MRLSFVLLSLFLAACGSKTILSPYKIDIQQGNYVTQEMVSKLKPGMTKSQVRFVLGTPLVTDVFHSDRWDYIYSYSKAGALSERRNITVFFADGKLTRIEGDVVPSAAQDKVAPTEEIPKAEAAPATESPKMETVPTEHPTPDKTKEAKPQSKNEPKGEKGFFSKMLEKIGL